MSLSRRAFLVRSAAAASGLSLLGPRALAALSSPLAACPEPSFRTSLSISPFAETVLAQCALTDHVSVARTLPELQQLFNRYGATETYQRIATLKSDNQGDDELGWARGLDRARLSRDLGMPFNPELGLWAQYGDGSSYQQPPDFSDYPSIRLPGPWTNLTLEQMLPIMRQYGELVARQILGTGVALCRQAPAGRGRRYPHGRPQRQVQHSHLGLRTAQPGGAARVLGKLPVGRVPP